MKLRKMPALQNGCHCSLYLGDSGVVRENALFRARCAASAAKRAAIGPGGHTAKSAGAGPD